MSLTLPTEVLYTENDTDGTTFDSDDFTPTANKLHFFAVSLGTTSGGGVAVENGGTLTFSGTGLPTIAKIGDSVSMSGSTVRVALYAAMSGGTTTLGHLTLTQTVSHSFAIFGGYRWAEPTAAPGIVGSPVLANLNNSAGPLALTMPTAGKPTNGHFVVCAYRGQATGGTPGGGVTELRDDGIDGFKRLWVAASATPVTAPSITLTGDPDGNYTGAGIVMLGVEVDDVVSTGFLVDGKIVFDYTPPSLEPRVAREYIVKDGLWVPVHDGVIQIANSTP